MTDTDAVRRDQADQFADQLGLDRAAMHAGALAAWRNLSPQGLTWQQALSAAAAVLSAAGFATNRRG